jgi:uncharacterized membrane protein (DUF485 family)
MADHNLLDEHLTEEQYEKLSHSVMWRQSKLSLRIAFIFLAMLLGLPLINRYMPEVANATVGGFTLSWLFLAVLFYPITWLLSWFFIRESNRIEADTAAWQAEIDHARSFNKQGTAATDAAPKEDRVQ